MTFAARRTWRCAAERKPIFPIITHYTELRIWSRRLLTLYRRNHARTSAIFHIDMAGGRISAAGGIRVCTMYKEIDVPVTQTYWT